MRYLTLAILPLALLANCKAPAEQANPDKYFQPETSNLPGANGAGNSKDLAVKAGDPLSPFNKDGSVRSSFPDGVVQRLNAIVAQSKGAIDKYDTVRAGFEKTLAASKAAPADKALAAKATAAKAEVASLHGEAKAAKDALSAEGQKLLDSKSYYDTVIFSGMATFVSKVEKELADDLKAMGGEAGK